MQTIWENTPWLLAVFGFLTALAAWFELFGKTSAPFVKAAKGLHSMLRKKRSLRDGIDSLTAAVQAQSTSLRTQQNELQALRADTLALSQSLEKLTGSVQENEKSRLSEIILRYGGRVRSGESLSGEEFRFVQSAYRKYADELHGNSIITDEYELILARYNQSSPFPANVHSGVASSYQ